MSILAPVQKFVDLGGPVLVILASVSVVTLAIVLLKFWQFRAEGVGQHKEIREALAQWDAGQAEAAAGRLKRSTSHLARVLQLAIEVENRPEGARRMEAEAEEAFMPLERGLRVLDIVVQLAPLLGLFGTVLGMIEAFQSLQEAGSQVDPSALAGGIWVALLTTAAGLAVAMPTSMALTWFESRINADRTLAETAFAVFLTPLKPASVAVANTNTRYGT
ncbi:MAG: MotA/TolQ/ExbB proton channel family protein [Hyphomonas sp.]